MKKQLSFMAIILLIITAGGHAQERANVVESITPQSVMLFMKTARIRDLLESIRFVKDNLLSRETSEKFGKKILDFKNKTGVNPLDIESLKNAGINVDQTASLAMYPTGKSKVDPVLIFIPVFNGKTFPLKFVDIVKKMAGSAKAEMYPAITDYRNYTVYQLDSDLFTTSIDDNFIIGSTGDLVRSVIDVKVDNTGYLSLDPIYADYLSKAKKRYDVRAFATKDFLKEMVKEKAAPGRRMDKKSSESNATAGAQVAEAADTINVPAKNPSVRSELNRLSAGPSLFNAVDYVALGASVTPSDCVVDLSARFNNGSETVNTFLQTIRTGAAERALYVRNAATYAYVSLDYKKIEELCKRGAPGCALYAQFKDEIRDELGLDFEKDIAPSYSGVLNIIAGEAKGAGGGYVLYFPMNDPAQTKKLLARSSDYLKEKFAKTGRYGTGAIQGTASFWYVDSKNTTIHLAGDARGIYMGNDVELIAAAIKAKDIGHAGARDEVVGTLGGNVFFLASMKKDSFFGALLMLYAYRNREISGVVEKMTELYLVGEKSADTLSFGLTVRLAKGN